MTTAEVVQRLVDTQRAELRDVPPLRPVAQHHGQAEAFLKDAERGA